MTSTPAAEHRPDPFGRDRYDPDAWVRDNPRPLFGLDLRYLLTDLIHRPPLRVWAVKELVAELTRQGFELGGRPSKTVSDHLRTEISRGRVRRVGWGAYAAGRMPDSTRRRIRNRARQRREWLAGVGLRT